MKGDKEIHSEHDTRLSVYDFIGSQYCVTEEDGARLYEKLKCAWNNRNRIVLDFGGVRVCASPFFNFSVGALITQDLHDTTNLNDWIQWEHLSQPSMRLLDDVIENASLRLAHRISAEAE